MLTKASGEGTKANAAAEAADESDAAASVRKAEGRGLVRARLRARLVERCKHLLVDTLAERHGAHWAQEVLQENFVVHQAMLRICESFGLRPHLEAQVLWAVRKCALERSQCTAETSADRKIEESLLPLLPHVDLDSDCESDTFADSGPAERGPLAPESDVAWSPTPSPCPFSPSSSVPTSPRLLSSAATSAGPSPLVAHLRLPQELLLPELSPLPELAAPGSELGWLKRQSSGEAQTTSCTSEEFAASSCEDSSEDEGFRSPREESPRAPEGGPLHGASDPKAEVRKVRITGPFQCHPRVVLVDAPGAQDASSVRCEATAGGRRRTRPWAWALWALGGLRGSLHPLHSGGHRELPPQLAADVAPLAHVGAACVPLAPVKPAAPALSGAAGTRHKDKAGSSLHFAGSSEVCFFVVDEAADAAEPYQRSIQTKGFDGPSGHKARRKKAQVPPAEVRRGGLWSRLGLGASSMLDTARIEAASEVEDEDLEEKADGSEDDWHDQCDEIAELMSQQRNSLLWSASW